MGQDRRRNGAPPPLGRTLDRIGALCTACVSDTGVDGGGVAVMSSEGVPTTLYASDARSTAIEDLQFTLGEGPCIDAVQAGWPVLVSDLTDPLEGVASRWPVFLEEAREAGVRAVFAIPVRIGAISLGTLDLYRASPGPLVEHQLSAALTTSDLLGQCLLDLDTQHVNGIAPATYRMAVHQAAGMVTVQAGVSIEDALARLRATAYSEGTSINAVAADVVAGRRRFQEEHG